MEGLSLGELQQRKQEMASQVVAAEANYLLQKQRMEDARDQWAAMQGADKALESLINSIKAKVDSAPKQVDNPVGAEKYEVKENGDGTSDS